MKVGSIVECVGNDKELTKYEMIIYEHLIKIGCVYPEKNETYVIGGMMEANGLVGIYLEEIINPKVFTTMGLLEISFDITCFRELLPPMQKEIEELLKEPEILELCCG